jgi:hypothetical protein
VEELGAGSRTQGVKALTELTLEFIGAHGGRLRRGTVGPRVGHAPPGTNCSTPSDLAPEAQKIDQCVKDCPTVSSRLFLVVVPRRQEVHQDEDEERRRDERDGDCSHRLLPLRLSRRVTSGLSSLLPWFIGEWLRQLIRRAC